MIAIICAMAEERDALLKKMKDVTVKDGKKLHYRDSFLDNRFYEGKIGNKEVVITMCGVGKVFASIVTTLLLEEYNPELVINLGCAGSVNKDVHVGDVVVANRVADWEAEFPEWERSIYGKQVSFGCSKRVTDLVNQLSSKTKIHVGPIVSADAFISRDEQVKTIKQFFPEALCGEMEGSAVVACCYAKGVDVTIIRSISDETLKEDNYSQFDFNLESVCETAAQLAEEIIQIY